MREKSLLRWFRLVLFLALLLSPLTASAQESGAEKDWNAALTAAKKEGKVTVVGAPDPVMRNEIVPRFTSRFGIPVEFLAGRSSELAARIKTERQAGLNTVDLFMSGISVSIGLYTEKLLDPLKPLLTLPEVADPSKWKKGKLWFIDPEDKYILRAFSSVASAVHINTDYVKPADLKAVRDLLNPQWRGKIATEDPTDSGSGQNQASRFYVQMGEDFVRRLYADQKPVITRDRRQLADWLARGTYPICLSCREDDVAALRKDGFPILEIFNFSDIAGSIGGSPWLLEVLSKPPHPNAAKIFANWIVSKEGLEIYSRGHGASTLRTDVDESFLKPETIPRPGVNYFDTSDWKWSTTGRKEVEERVKKLLKGR